jgi:hypothetical protein
MMKRKAVGYFEGTDPAVLTSLVCDGCVTIPISNGLDNHGQYIRLINEESKVDLLIAYMHKIDAPLGYETQPEDIFHICQVYQIPFLVIVPRELHTCASRQLKAPQVVRFVDPSEVLQTAREILGR